MPGHGFNRIVVLRLICLGSWDEMLTLRFFHSHLQIKDKNALTGVIPTQIGELTNLAALYLCKWTCQGAVLIVLLYCAWIILVLETRCSPCCRFFHILASHLQIKAGNDFSGMIPSQVRTLCAYPLTYCDFVCASPIKSKKSVPLPPVWTMRYF